VPAPRPPPQGVVLAARNSQICMCLTSLLGVKGRPRTANQRIFFGLRRLLAGLSDGATSTLITRHSGSNRMGAQQQQGRERRQAAGR
jgi:hypothetical protein